MKWKWPRFVALSEMVNTDLFTIILAVLVWHLKVLNLSPVLLHMMVSYMLRNSTHGLRDWSPMESQSSRVKKCHALTEAVGLCRAQQDAEKCPTLWFTVARTLAWPHWTIALNCLLFESSSFFNANWGCSLFPFHVTIICNIPHPLPFLVAQNTAVLINYIHRATHTS